MAFKRITENDMLGKGNVGKPDTPGVSTSEMQRIMDELPREVIAPAFNELSGQLEANTASADIGANAPDGITPDPAPAENSPAKLQSVLQGIVNKITDHIADQVKHVKSEERTLWNNASNDRHTHDNKSILDGITSSLVGNWNAAFAHISDAVRHITENERTNWNDKYTKSETDKAINERVVEIGSSDMTKAVYDPETRNLPYIPKIDAEALTLGKNVVLSGTPVSIAYAGTNRIASITAYGENAQGGTTEAPVALTGISSVTVNDDVTELPIPRPLRRVGYVKDKCVTRVKSVYDKRIVLDGTENWKMGGAVGDGAPHIFCDLLNDHYKSGPLVSSRIPPTSILTSNKNQGIGCWDRSLYLRYDSLFTNVEELKTYLSAHPLTVYYQSTAYDGTNGLDVCLMKYQTGFVELDGTEGIEYQSAYNRFAYTLPSTAVNDSGFCSHYKKLMTSAPGEDKYIVIRPEAVYFYDSQYTNADAFNAYLAAQKEAGTPVQVAYQLATPEVYATDPVDFDNAAGPLTVMTGGELEVRMTELIGSRSDVSNNTVAFAEAAQDADIASGEKLSVLFGKIKKRFSVVNKLVNGAVYPNLLDNSDFTNLVNQRGEAVYDYLTGIGYGPDRWQLVEAKYTLASQTVTSAGSSHTYGSQLRQIIPLEKIKIGDTVTASISTESGILNGTAKLELKIDTSVSDLPYVIEQDWGGVKIGCIKENVCHVIVFLKENKSVKINWVKLEKGSVATPYVPNGYGAELSECLRYYYQVASVRTFGQQHTGAGTYVNIILPQVMRVTPTVSAPGEWTIRFNGMDKKATVSSVGSLNGNTLKLTMSTIAGGTYIGPLYAFYDGKITFSADL